MVALAFNAREVDPTQTRSLWPDGQYIVIISKTEMVAVKEKPGNHFLALTLKCIQGAKKDEQNIMRLNLYNDNSTASDIARRELSAICYCIGRPDLTDSDQLINIPFIVNAKITKTSQGELNNFDGFCSAQGVSVKDIVAGLGTQQQTGYQQGSAPQPQQGPAPQPQQQGPAGAGWAPNGPQQQQPAQQQGPAPGAWAPPGGPAPQPGYDANVPVPGQAGPAPTGWPQQQPQQGPAPAQGPAQTGWTPPAGPQPQPGPWAGQPQR